MSQQVNEERASSQKLQELLAIQYSVSVISLVLLVIVGNSNLFPTCISNVLQHSPHIKKIPSCQSQP